jgi:hypothetical protein
MSRPVIQIVLVVAAVLTLAACGAGASPSGSVAPSVLPAGGLVTTEADAVARVIAYEPRFTGIRPRDPGMIGQSSWYEVAPASGVGAFIVSVRVGWGDCPAGCIDEHTWVFSVTPDGTVTLQSEGGAEVPPAAFPSPGGGDGTGTGIHVIAIAGPTCPVETVPPDPACAPKPVSNVTVLVMDAGGVVQAKVVLDAAGQQFLGLQPGAYVVNAEGGVAGFMNGPEAQRVTVEDGRITEVTLAFDTGIR